MFATKIKLKVVTNEMIWGVEVNLISLSLRFRRLLFFSATYKTEKNEWINRANIDVLLPNLPLELPVLLDLYNTCMFHTRLCCQDLSVLFTAALCCLWIRPFLQHPSVLSKRAFFLHLDISLYKSPWYAPVRSFRFKQEIIYIRFDFYIF